MNASRFFLPPLLSHGVRVTVRLVWKCFSKQIGSNYIAFGNAKIWLFAEATGKPIVDISVVFVRVYTGVGEIKENKQWKAYNIVYHPSTCKKESVANQGRCHYFHIHLWICISIVQSLRILSTLFIHKNGGFVANPKVRQILHLIIKQHRQRRTLKA